MATQPNNRPVTPLRQRMLDDMAILLEQNDEWAVQRTRYMTLESISQMSEDPLVTLPALAA